MASSYFYLEFLAGLAWLGPGRLKDAELGSRDPGRLLISASIDLQSGARCDVTRGPCSAVQEGQTLVRVGVAWCHVDASSWVWYGIVSVSK